MKFYIISLILISSYKLAICQSNLEFYTETGEKFYVVVNGIKQNDEPQYNVQVNNLIKTDYNFIIIFEDTTIANIIQTIRVKDKDGRYLEASYVIKKNKKNVYELEKTISKETKRENTNNKIGEVLETSTDIAKRLLVAKNIYSYVLTSVTYDTKLFGTDNVKVYIQNNSGYLLDKVFVSVQFLGNITGQVYCIKDLVFTNVPADSKKYYLNGPYCSNGKLVTVAITKIVSKELGIY